MAAIPAPADDKENWLREDRRLLGRLLGEVIRAQAGEEALNRIERIRQAAVTFRRENTGQAELDEPILAAVLRLWLTSMLRLVRLQAADEATNGVNYFRLTFLPELPRLYAEFEQALKERFALAELPWLPPFLTVGSWIGGDRDGNPNVDAAVLRTALVLQARLLLPEYLVYVHQLGRELGLSARLARVSPAVQALAERSGDRSPHRQDEPYRRALTGIYARLAATLQALAQQAASPPPIGKGAPYASADEFAAELDTIAAALESQGAGLLALGRLRSLRRKVSLFGFHLAPLDLRQSSDVHEASVDELLARAGIGGYSALDEARRVELLTRELPNPRPLRSPHLEYSALVQKELAITDAAAEGPPRAGERAGP